MSVAVTMFFDLKSLADSTTEVRPVEFYVKNGKTTLSQNIPMVILCDASTRPWIEAMRSANSSAQTVYIERPLIQYDHYVQNYDIIHANRESKSAYTNSRNTTSYCLTTTLKFIAINIAAKIFPEATHYFWLDFGCAHIADCAAEFLPIILENPNPRVSCAYIHYRPHHEVEPMQRYLERGNPCSLAATIFSVEKSYLSDFFTRSLSIFYEMLSKGVGHNEEAVLCYLYDRYPEMFHLYYGDYYSTICNYKLIHRDFPSIRSFYLSNCIRAGARKNIEDCLAVIRTSLEAGTLVLSDDDKAFIESLG